MITLLVSGGQTGADQAGLKAGRRLGIRTSGYAPLGWRTEAGPAAWLSQYNLIQCDSADYVVRTELNIIIADATVIFGRISPGSSLTEQMCKEIGKPSLWLKDYQPINAHAEFRLWIERNKFRSLNITGSRESKQRGIGAAVEIFLLEVLPLCAKQVGNREAT